MAVSHFQPAAGNFGETYITLARTLPTAVITAEATVRHYLPIVAAERTAANGTELLYYKGGALVVGGATASTTGETTARVVKRVTGGTITPISATVVIPTTVAAGTVLAFPVLTTATDAQRTVRPNAGDTLLIEVTNASGGSVSTQPGDVQAAIKCAVLR